PPTPPKTHPVLAGTSRRGPCDRRSLIGDRLFGPPRRGRAPGSSRRELPGRGALVSLHQGGIVPANTCPVVGATVSGYQTDKSNAHRCPLVAKSCLACARTQAESAPRWREVGPAPDRPPSSPVSGPVGRPVGSSRRRLGW